MMPQEFVSLTATQLLAGYASGDFSPVEVLYEQIQRHETIDAQYGAVVDQTIEQALAQAKESERRWHQRDSIRPLEGVTVAIKEEEPVRGRPLTEGSALHSGRIAGEDSLIVQRIRASGAVLPFRTATPEFSSMPFTRSLVWGAARNPWNPEASPGGSSGGSAIAVATGQSTLATGSDIGGSIREPAAFCGVVGYKPPHGRVPGVAPFNLDSYAASGPLARSVSDAALLQNVMAGPDPSDHASLRPKYVLSDSTQDASGLRIAATANWGNYAVEDSVQVAFDQAIAVLRAAGAIVEEIDLNWTAQQIGQVTYAHFGYSFGESLRDSVSSAREQGIELSPYVAAFAERVAAARANYTFASLLEAEAEIALPLSQLLDRFDAVVGPTNVIEMFRADDDYVDGVLEDGTPYQFAKPAFALNVIGRVPSLTIPVGFSGRGVPVGATIVSRSYDDERVFSLGRAWERALEQAGLTRDWRLTDRGER